MRWNRHLKILPGDHAFLSPSGYHWIHYTPARLIERWTAAQAGAFGVMQHVYALNEIQAGRKSDLVGTVGLYINDAIKYRMTCEQVLYYSDNCFGTADTISFRRNKLRIHDLKTGVVPGSVHQLEIYAALFCLEYEMNPFGISIELRIYQADKVEVYEPDPEDIAYIMERIQEFDRLINFRRMEEET